MESLIAILLYLSLIVDGGIYTKSEIHTIEQTHATGIEAVQHDTAQMVIVSTKYVPRAAGVTVLVNPYQE